MKKTIAALTFALSLPSLAHAGAYKCPQANGHFAFQDRPCPAGASGSQINLVPAQGYAAGDSRKPSGNAAAGQAAPADPRYPYARGDDVQQLKAANADLQAQMAKIKAENPNWQHDQTLMRLSRQAEALNAQIQADGKAAR